MSRPTGSDFVELVLDALETDAQDHPEARAGQDPEAGSPELQMELKRLAAVSRELSREALSVALAGLGCYLYQLRHWYCMELGMLMITILETVAEFSQRLPKPHDGPEPALSICRILEGLLLVNTILHAPEAVAGVLEKLLKKRRVPPFAILRLEAELGRCWLEREKQVNGVPQEVMLDTMIGDSKVMELAQSLCPGEEALEELESAKETLQQIVALVFPDHTLEFFGSAVNGFQTHASDIDCVIVESDTAPASHAASSPSSTPAGRRAQKDAAIELAEKLQKALLSEPFQEYGLVPEELVSEARVPILKCQFQNGLSVDMSFNNRLPIYNTKLLRAYATMDKRVQQLGLLVKHWARVRGINNAKDGTISSYTFILLVIHYLQHVKLLVNLQDVAVIPEEKREELGCDELLDGTHKVWYLEPELTVKYHQNWKDTAPFDSTLEGLLMGFFRYYAYEFPTYRDVASIRLRGGTERKIIYFRDALSGAVDEAGEVEAEDHMVEAIPEVGQSNLDDAEEDCDGSSGSEEIVPRSGPVPEPKAAEEQKDPAVEPKDSAESKDTVGVKHRLSARDHAIQHRIGGRLTLCVDDPIERGRSLGTNFSGMSKIMCELRRASELLKSGANDQVLAELFAESSTKSLHKMFEKREFPSIIEVPRSMSSASGKIVSKKCTLQGKEIGLVMGLKGSTIKSLQQVHGILNLRIKDENKNTATLNIRGTCEGVDEVFSRVKNLKQQKSESRPNNSGPPSWKSVQSVKPQQQTTIALSAHVDSPGTGTGGKKSNAQMWLENSGRAPQEQADADGKKSFYAPQVFQNALNECDSTSRQAPASGMPQSAPTASSSSSSREFGSQNEKLESVRWLSSGIVKEKEQPFSVGQENEQPLRKGRGGHQVLASENGTPIGSGGTAQSTSATSWLNAAPIGGKPQSTPTASSSSSTREPRSLYGETDRRNVFNASAGQEKEHKVPAHKGTPNRWTSRHQTHVNENVGPIGSGGQGTSKRNSGKDEAATLEQVLGQIGVPKVKIEGQPRAQHPQHRVWNNGAEAASWENGYSNDPRWKHNGGGQRWDTNGSWGSNTTSWGSATNVPWSSSSKGKGSQKKRW